MILNKARDFVKERKQVSLGEIAEYLRSDRNAVSGMLEHWVRKGKIKQVQVSNCSGCSVSSCSVGKSEVYVWNE